MAERTNIDWLKRKAKKLKKEQNITHSVALEIIARDHGFANWKDCSKQLKESEVQS